MTSTKAPYEAGGTIRLLHEGRAGTTLADLPIVAVTRLTDGRWRVTAQRDHESCPTVEVTVRADGHDDDGYVVPRGTAVAS